MWREGEIAANTTPPLYGKVDALSLFISSTIPVHRSSSYSQLKRKTKNPYHHISCDFLFLSYIHAAESCTLIFSCTCEKGSPSLLTFLLDGKVTDWKKQLSPISWSYTRWYFSVLFPRFKASILVEKIKRNKTDPKEAA